jgi:hypothetical protein
MLQAKELFDEEMKACRASFSAISWDSNYLENLPLTCPECGSPLVEQDDPTNTNHQSMNSHCRACGDAFDPLQLVESSLERYLEVDTYLAAKDGGDAPVAPCPECEATAYLSLSEHVGCIWCGEVLGDCAVCSVGLTPENYSPDHPGLCAYHADLLGPGRLQQNCSAKVDD